jgi:hypothetical protein
MNIIKRVLRKNVSNLERECYAALEQIKRITIPLGEEDIGYYVNFYNGIPYCMFQFRNQPQYRRDKVRAPSGWTPRTDGKGFSGNSYSLELLAEDGEPDYIRNPSRRALAAEITVSFGGLYSNLKNLIQGQADPKHLLAAYETALDLIKSQ